MALVRWSGWAAESVAERGEDGLLRPAGGRVLAGVFHTAEVGGQPVVAKADDGVTVDPVTDEAGCFTLWTDDTVTQLWLDRGSTLDVAGSSVALPRRRILPHILGSGGGSSASASETAPGLTEYADDVETSAGSRGDRSVSPLRLAGRLVELLGGRGQPAGFVGLDGDGRAQAASPDGANPVDLTTVEWTLARLAERTGVYQPLRIVDPAGFVKAGGAAASPAWDTWTTIPALTKVLPAGAQRWQVEGLLHVLAAPAGGFQLRFSTGTPTALRVLGRVTGVVDTTTKADQLPMQRLGTGSADRDTFSFSGTGTNPTTASPRVVAISADVWTPAAWTETSLLWQIRQTTLHESNVVVTEGSSVSWSKPAPGVPA